MIIIKYVLPLHFRKRVVVRHVLRISRSLTSLLVLKCEAEHISRISLLIQA
jgi:hypothetical protein